MKRKIIGILAAVLLAGIGTAALIVYVESAKDRAVAAEELVDVYVVSQPIAKGSPIGQIKESVETAGVPAKVVPEDAVTDLSDLDETLVAAVDLQPGEQLLTSRLIDPADLSRATVPAGLQELTVALDPARAVGGSLNPGDTVGVVLSFDPFDLPQSDDQSPNMTHLTFHKILVTSVQFADGDPAAGTNTPAADGGTTETAEPAPANGLLVTLALDSSQVEQVVFAAEFGHIWLTAENANASEAGTRVVTLGEVYGPAVAQ
jgi:pilus assembly protein CpaB